MIKDTKYIIIQGAKVNNLKNISVKIPRDKLVVITGLSGSGKSSLAFDTIFAEGQRRYMESLSSYARQFLGTIPKPNVDHIEGLSPAISIDQKSTIRSPRSTVGTMSDIYDYIRLLFTHIGVPHCPYCKKILQKQIINKKNERGLNDSKIKLYCTDCQCEFPAIKISSFSFNSPDGACPDCRGLGKKLVIDSAQIFPNMRLTLAEGAIRPWSRSTGQNSTYQKMLQDLALRCKFNLNTPVGKLSKQVRNLILFGDNEFKGVIPDLEIRHKETSSDYIRKEIKKYMVEKTCDTCKGTRLRPEILTITINNKNINAISSLSIAQLKDFIFKLETKNHNNEETLKIIKQITSEIITRLGFLTEVGLSYLTLNRGSNSLSGGEAQRIRLATQLGSYLTGVLYILDEPSIGLHQVDQAKLIKALNQLRDLGNSVLVVEHDQQTMEAADYIIDMGPQAGELGGEIVAQGSISTIKQTKNSLTAQYLTGEQKIDLPKKYRTSKNNLIIKGAKEHNLKNIDVRIPLNNLVCITGVSGSGKSTLVSDILARALKKKFYRTKTQVGAHRALIGTNFIDKIIEVDQSPIGRTPRSNPVTYTGTFSLIREVFSELEQAKARGYNSGHFSFNMVGGRCETCRGDGVLKFEMYFLPDAYVTCPTCGGNRYNKEILDIYYKPKQAKEGKNIAEILEMTISEALNFFQEYSLLHYKLQVLNSVGLGYIRLGQSATTLSGGEAQRIKLATELARKDTGKTLYVLDEPTTGLHFEDIKRLLKVLQALVDKGNSVIVIEHNLDVIKCADHIIDLGPEGGEAGGRIVACGTPQHIIKAKNSLTGKYLVRVLK